MRGSLSMLLALTLSCTFATHPAAAQTCAGSGKFNVSSFTASPATVAFSTPTQAEMDNQLITYSGTITVAGTINKPNEFYDVCIKANSASMGGSKSSADVEWRLSTSSTWNPLSTNYVLLQVWGRGPGDPKDWSLVLYYRMRLPASTTTPGAYSAPITYLILSQS